MKLFLLACSLFFILPLHAQITTTSAAPEDSGQVSHIIPDIYKNVTDSNFFLNVSGTPQSLSALPVKRHDREELFYLIAGLLLILGLMKTLYDRYFTTLFRVFFNTSLRQNQLTDQLMQAKLPSLIFNSFFIVTAGLYIFLILQYYSLQGDIPDWNLIGLSTAVVGGIYFVKYISLLFIGWITNFSKEAEMYIFIVFLLNKITAILLLPFIILIAFSTKNAAGYVIFISAILLALILLMRFYRSYALLHSKSAISAFHLFIYVAALEILPIALLYKAVMLFLGIKL